MALTSTFGSQATAGMASVVQGMTPCGALQALVNSMIEQHGGDAQLASTSRAAPEWNTLAAELGCGEPFPGRGMQSHPDVGEVRQMILTAIGGIGPQQQQQQQVQQQQQYVQQGPTLGPGAPPPPSGFIGGLLDNVVKDWAKLPTSTPKGEVWMAARQSKSDARNVAILKAGGVLVRALMAVGAKWAYWNGQKWQIDMTGPDKDISQSDILPGTGYNNEGMPQGTNGTQPETQGGGNTLLDSLGGGIEPTIVQTRRCPGPMRLAINGLCYHKSVLPAALRMNRPRKAVVSYSEGRAILKGFNAARKISKISKKTGSAARTLAPKPRRRRLPAARRAIPSGSSPIVIDTD